MENKTRRPRTDIEHTCDIPDYPRCPCRQRRKAEQRAEDRRKDPRYAKDENLWRLYKIRLIDYEAMREAQGYRCAICGTHEDDLPQSKAGRPRKDGTPPTPPMKLVVDHCHGSNKVRALLCHRCNVGLGWFETSAHLLEAFQAYLAGHSSQPTVQVVEASSAPAYPDDF